MKSIYQMLFEMATGNLSVRLKQTEYKDDLDEFIGVLNMLATALQNTISKSGYVTPFYTYQNLTQLSIELDSKFHIKSFNNDTIKLLNYKHTDLVTLEFNSILAPQSQQVWNKIISEINHDDNNQSTVQLFFLTNQKKVIPSFCTINKHFFSDRFIVNSITTILNDTIGDLGYTRSISPKKTDAVIVQNVHDYILNNLEDQLPTSTQLAKMFGTNEFKLKDGFRNFYKTSIYQFYNNERLKKAHSLIQKSDFPLKEIAYMCGFNSYLNFYKAFKKRYLYSPSELYRESDIE